MAAHGERQRPDPPGRGHGPPPPAAPRTWQSVEEARAELRRSAAARKRGKAAAKRDRARAAQRAAAVAAGRRAALSRQAVERPAPQPRALAQPGALPDEELVDQESARSGQPRRSAGWLAAGITAGLVVAGAMAAGVVAVASNVGSWSTGLAADPAEPPAAAVGQAPPAAQETGHYVQSTVDAQGRLSTEHWIVRDSPIRALKVRMQPSTELISGTSDLQRIEVEADGRRLSAAADRLAAGSGTIRLDRGRLDGGARTVRLQYVTGSVVEQTGSTTASRALVFANPLQVKVKGDSDPAEPLVVQLAGDRVLSLSCTAEGQVPQPCGRPDRSGWRVRLDDPKANVVAQVDLPEP